ncbi:MAG: hypothetical protein ACFFD4_21015 [Candidatus Odinarchaeota archaeon]
MAEFLSIINLLNLVCAVFSLLTSMLIIKKDHRDWLNRLLFLTFFIWALSVFFYTFVEFAALGEILINLVRDLNVVFGIVAAYCLLMAGLVLSRGEKTALKLTNVSLVGAVTLVLVIVALFDDKVVIDAEGAQIITGTAAATAIFIIPGLSAITGVAFFIQARREIEDVMVRKRILFFILGSSLLVLGALAFGVGNIAFPGEDVLAVDLFSELCWGAGQVAIVWGLYMVKTG